MDLTVLIVLLIGGLLLYYLMDIIRSLRNEIREMKIKCIKLNNDDASIYTENTIEPKIAITENMINFLNIAKNIFNTL